LVFAFCRPLWAADDRLCDAYAAEAVKAAQQVRDNNCGYDLSNPEWSLDWGVHLRWCLNAEVDSVDAERDYRRNKSNFCGWCRFYAVGAAKMVAKAIDNKCLGVISGGPRWNPYEENHFQWCMGLPAMIAAPGTPEGTSDEDKAREAELGECLVGKTQQGLTAETAKPIRPKLESPKSASRLKREGKNISSINLAGPDGKVLKRKTGTEKKTTKVRAVKTGPCAGLNGRPCKTSNTNLLSPGLLEGDSGFSRQSPSATGTPISPSSGSRGTISIR
jgi:hypothetical protein